MRYLEGAKELADVLVVAVNSDARRGRYKGPGRPHIPEAERAELVAALACTDRVVVFDEPNVRAIIRRAEAGRAREGDGLHAGHHSGGDEVRPTGGRVAVAGDPKNHSTTELHGREGPGKGLERLAGAAMLGRPLQGAAPEPGRRPPARSLAHPECGTGRPRSSRRGQGAREGAPGPPPCGRPPPAPPRPGVRSTIRWGGNG